MKLFSVLIRCANYSTQLHQQDIDHLPCTIIWTVSPLKTSFGQNNDKGWSTKHTRCLNNTSHGIKMLGKIIGHQLTLNVSSLTLDHWSSCCWSLVRFSQICHLQPNRLVIFAFFHSSRGPNII